jgi:hypothetical protein
MKKAFLLSFAAVAIAAPVALGQHEGHVMGAAGGASPTLSGQYAFATISEIVKILKADSSTDWTKVNLEALRQHLVDMDDVIMRSTVAKRVVAGGLQMDVTGTGRTAAAINRMVGGARRAVERAHRLPGRREGDPGRGAAHRDGEGHRQRGDRRDDSRARVCRHHGRG